MAITNLMTVKSSNTWHFIGWWVNVFEMPLRSWDPVHAAKFSGISNIKYVYIALLLKKQTK